MRMLISTVGSRGDIQPFVALGSELSRRGHDVTLATHAPFKEMVEAHALSFAPLPGDPMAVLETDAAQVLLQNGRGILGFGRRFVGLLRPWFDDLVAAVERLHLRQPDLVVYSPLTFPSWHIAEADGTPTLLASLQPLVRTSEFPAITLGTRNLRGPVNRLSHQINEQVFWQPLRRAVNDWRTDRLGLAPLPWDGPFRLLRRRQEVQIAGFSRLLVPPPSDWPDSINVTGAWHRDGLRPLSTSARAFLESGPAPIYIGFGSMSDTESERLSGIAIEASRRVGRRLVLASGWAGLSGAASDDVIVVGDEPHDELFAHCAAVVHHGGAGTAHSTARSGTPSVVVPFFADQPFWAVRLEAAGLAPTPLLRRNLDVDALSVRLEAVDSPKYRSTAARVGAMMRREPGVVAAADIAERHATSRGSRRTTEARRAP